jgi:hypothetical protein
MVTFKWATKTSLQELNISNLTPNQMLPSHLHPMQHRRQSSISLFFPHLICFGLIGFRLGDLFFIKICNSLNIVRRNDVRLSLITLQPDIKNLASVHQAQGTH